MSEWVVVGRLGKSHGLRGWLKVNSFTQPIENILDYQPWHIKRLGEMQRLDCTGKQLKANTILVQPEECTAPEQAALYNGLDILVSRQQLPNLPSGEYYWTDLEGLTVITKQEIVLGKIAYLIETGSNDIMVIKGGKEYWLPYLPGQVVLDIDLDKQIMRVDWSEELLD